MARFKLTPLAKKLVFGVVAVGIVGGLVAGGVFSKASQDMKNIFKGKTEDEMYAQAGAINKEEGVINISLDEWIGWKSIIDANGGLTTQKGSIYDELGLKVNISVINDATQSSNALIKGDLDAAGYTVNRYAFLYNKFKENNVATKMAFVTNSSNGGDGIIAKKDIKSIEDLVGKKIGVPRYSEAQTLVEWLLQKSSLTDAQVQEIRNNMVLFDTPDDCAKAFFAGELDAAATWQPYLDQAKSLGDSHVLFDTTNATNIILDGLVFREDFINNNRETVSKLLEGALKAESIYTTDATAISNTFPMFATQSAEDTLAMTSDAALYNCASNISALSDNGAAVSLFRDMSVIWNTLGESADPNNATKAFDVSIAKDLEDKFPNETVIRPSFTEEQKQTAKEQSNDEALLTQRLSITFETNSASISPESYSALNEFIKTASILDGTIIQIEGNTDSTGDAAYNTALSEKRARSVAMYLQAQGLDSSRFIVVGNGPSNPIADNNTPEGQAANRRTDVYFKVVK